MPPFIQYTLPAVAHSGELQKTVYLNVSQIATARYEPKSRVLELELIGSKLFPHAIINGDEAEAALKVIQHLLS